MHSPHSTRNISRRDFLTAAVIGSTGLLVGCQSQPAAIAPTSAKSVVSIAKIKDGDIGAAVKEAIDLLGGIENITAGKDRIMLKPNLECHAATHL